MRDYHDNNYIDGRYPAIKAPEEDDWYDDDRMDDDASWDDVDETTERGARAFDEMSYDDPYAFDGRPAWDAERQMAHFAPLPAPPRATTKRRIRSEEQTPSVVEETRAWRQEQKGNRQQESFQELDPDARGPRTPLLYMLLVTAAILTILGGIGRMRGYRELDYDWRSAPLLSLVMQGWHDGIDPIAALAGSAGTERPLADDGDTGTEDAQTDAAQADTLQTDEAEEEPLTAANLTIPEGINDAVVPAVDYGVCDSRLLAPEGTTFETLTSGIFAPNGTYYTPQEVDERYLADALFIGDSRTDGLRLYGGMADETSFWCKEALSVYDVFDDTAYYYAPGESGGAEMTLEEVLQTMTYRKVYLCIGINELGTPDTERFYEQYQTLVSYVRERQPEALIYIQGIMHVSASYSQSDSVFNNTNIVEKNTAIASLSNGRDILYLDMNDRVVDENGDLLDERSGDGIHLKASAYALWKEDVLSRAVVRSDADWIAADAGNEETGTAGAGTGKSESDISTETGLVVQ